MGKYFKHKSPPKKVLVYLQTDIIDRVDAICKEKDISRTRLINDCLHVFLHTKQKKA